MLLKMNNSKTYEFPLINNKIFKNAYHINTSNRSAVFKVNIDHNYIKKELKNILKNNGINYDKEIIQTYIEYLISNSTIIIKFAIYNNKYITKNISKYKVNPMISNKLASMEDSINDYNAALHHNLKVLKKSPSLPSISFRNGNTQKKKTEELKSIKYIIREYKIINEIIKKNKEINKYLAKCLFINIKEHIESTSLFKLLINDEYYYNIQEYIGISLIDILNKKDDLKKIAYKTLYNCTEALKLLHDLKYGHFDIKLDNIVVNIKNNDIRIKLIDFGGASKFGEKEGIMITKGYVSPDFIKNKYKRTLKSDKKYDIYSLGIVFMLLRCPYSYEKWRETNEIINSKILKNYINIKELNNFEKKILKGMLNEYNYYRWDINKLNNILLKKKNIG